jgi:MFS family permease
MELIQAKKSLIAAMCAVLLSCIGISLPYPILAPYFVEVQNAITTYNQLPPKFLLGLVLAVYPLGVLIGSALIGAASDVWGRKKVLLMSLFMSAFGYAGTILAFMVESFPLLLFTRFLTGLCEGNISVAKAIAVDLSPVLDKTRTFSLINATGYAGWLIGPLLGGLLEPWGIDFVFVVAVAITIFACFFISILLPADLKQSELPISMSFSHLIRKQNSFTLLKHKEILALFLVYFLATLGLNAYYEFYPVLLAENFTFSSTRIGLITALLTSFMIFTSVFVVTRIKNKIGLQRGALLGLFMLSLTLSLHSFISQDYIWPYYAFVGVCIALFNGFIPVYISDKFSYVGQGQLMGLLTTTLSLANVLIALFGSILAIINTHWAIMFGALLALSSTILFYHYLSQQKRILKN